jgi:ribosomal protein S18 acetylase RimI-like enzyme
MHPALRPIERRDVQDAARIWNGVIAEADSFPDDKPLSDDEAWAMFARQTVTACAFAGERMAGVYILHPTGFGRCGHIANASYAVDPAFRGRGVGRAMVTDCIARAREHGFAGLQFNAVVVSNHAAIALYLQLGFRVVGTIRNGFRLKDGGYRDTMVFLLTW